jgi:hypothetical protein
MTIVHDVGAPDPEDRAIEGAVTVCAKMRVVDDASSCANQAAEPVLSKKGLVAITSSSEALAFHLTKIVTGCVRQDSR